MGLKVNNKKLALVVLGTGIIGFSVGTFSHSNINVCNTPTHANGNAAVSNEISTLTNKLKSLNIVTEKLTKIDNSLYQVNGNGEVFFSTPSGSHLIFGEVLDVTGKVPVNLTLKAKFDNVKIELQNGNSIDYVSPNEKLSIVVFTDISCHYCKQLHQNIQSYLDAGISIHYLAFPREGSDSSTAEYMRSIWSSKDKNRLLDQAMNRGELPIPLKTDVVVTNHYNLGKQLGVSATPTLLLQNNQLAPGVLTPEEIIKAASK